MISLQFATGNADKFDEARRALAERSAGIDLVQLALDLPEIQTEDTEELLTAKAEFARARTARPFIIDDVSCVLAGTANFPGALAKPVLRGLGSEAMRRVFAEGLKIEVRCTVALSYLDEFHFFTGTVSGTIRHGQREVGAMPLNAMVYLDDQDRFLGDAGAVTHRAKALDALCAFLREREASDRHEQAQTADRWSERAQNRDATTRDETSYVNHEDDYGRFDRLLAKIMKTAARPTCLDIGCGTGQVTRLMMNSGAVAALGIDVSDGIIGAAQAAAEDIAGLSFRHASVPDLPEKAAYDIIASRGVVLSHLPKHRILDHLEAITRLSRPGSYAIFDFIQDIANGGFFNAGLKNAFSHDWISRVMRELGWIPVAKDGVETNRVVIAAFHRPFPDSLYLVSGNPRKLLELRAAADWAHLHGCDFDLPELKHDDIARIAADKARQAFAIVGRPVVSTDGGIFLDALDGFPGPNSKQAATKLKPEGLLKLLAGTENRNGRRRNTVVWFDGRNMRTHTDEVPIAIADAARGTYPAYPLDRVLIPTDAKNSDRRTYAEMPPEERVIFTELPGLSDFIKTCRPQ